MGQTFKCKLFNLSTAQHTAVDETFWPVSDPFALREVDGDRLLNKVECIANRKILHVAQLLVIILPVHPSLSDTRSW